MYDVKVYQDGVGELTVSEVEEGDSADPEAIRLVVYVIRPGT